MRERSSRHGHAPSVQWVNPRRPAVRAGGPGRRRPPGPPVLGGATALSSLPGAQLPSAETAVFACCRPRTKGLGLLRGSDCEGLVRAMARPRRKGLPRCASMLHANLAWAACRSGRYVRAYSHPGHAARRRVARCPIRAVAVVANAGLLIIDHPTLA